MPKQKVKVAFRIFPDPDYFDNPGIQVVALFPEVEDSPGLIMSYMHIGQHGSANPSLLKDLEPATEEEYADLLRELEGIYDDCELQIE